MQCGLSSGERGGMGGCGEALETAWITLARKMTNDAVGQAQPLHIDGSNGNVITVGSYDLQLSDECSVVYKGGTWGLGDG